MFDINFGDFFEFLDKPLGLKSFFFKKGTVGLVH